MILSVWRIVRDREDFDDAFQEATMAILKRLEKIRRHPNPQALILRICANAGYDALRRRSRRARREASTEILESVADPARPAWCGLADGETRAEIMAAVGRLPRAQAGAFLMRHVQELSYGEIAEALGCGEVTARTHVARARRRLAGLLADLDPRPAQQEAVQ